MNIAWVLFKKELHGVIWKAVSLAIIAVTIVIGGRYAWSQPLFSSSVHDSLVLALAAHGVFGGLFLAMHVSAVEQADGSIDFVRCLPVRTWIAGAFRIGVTWAAFAIPFAICGVAAVLVKHIDASTLEGDAGSLNLSNLQIWMSVLVAVTGGTSFYLWTVCLAMNQKTELRAGAIGLAVFAASILAGIGNIIPLTVLTPAGVLMWDVWLMHDPRVTATPLPPTSPTSLTIVLPTVLVNLALLVLAVWRYGRVSSGMGLPGSSRSPLRAWVRFHLMQAWPLGAATVVLALLLLLMAAGTPIHQLMVFTVMLGTVWSLVAGVTLFISDLEPRLEAFWRSRPILPEEWYWSKLAVGAALLLLVNLPLVLQSVITGHAAAVVPLVLHTVTFSEAVLWTCLVRQPIYAGIMAFASSAALILSVVIDRPGLRVWPAVQRFLQSLPNWNTLSIGDLAGTVGVPLAVVTAVVLALLLAGRWAAQKGCSIG